MWSRMRVVDEAAQRVALTNLHFEDFLEARPPRRGRRPCPELGVSSR